MKNKPKNVVDSFSCILDFPKFSGGGPPDPPYKGNTSIKPSKFFFTRTTAKRQKKKQKKTKTKKKTESPPQLKQSTRNLSLGYTEMPEDLEMWPFRFFTMVRRSSCIRIAFWILL